MPLRHHLDEVTEAQFKCDVPSHTQNDDLLVKVPSLEQILCRGRFRHRWQLSQDTEPFNSLHQNRLELKSDSFSYRTQLHSIPKLQHYLQDLTEGPSLQWNCLNRSGHPILPIELSCSSLLIMGASASDHFQSSFSLSAHHSLNSFLVFACSMSRATLYSQYRCHVSASMIRLVCSIALVRVAKAGSLSYLFPSRVHRGAQEPAVETGSIAHPLYSTTLENPFVASFILPPIDSSFPASPARAPLRITPPARLCSSPAFPVSSFPEHKESWQRSSLTCRAAERATRAASQFYALRSRTALLHTSPHPPEHEWRRDAG